jgi:hypothetical protein
MFKFVKYKRMKQNLNAGSATYGQAMKYALAAGSFRRASENSGESGRANAWRFARLMVAKDDLEQISNEIAGTICAEHEERGEASTSIKWKKALSNALVNSASDFPERKLGDWRIVRDKTQKWLIYAGFAVAAAYFIADKFFHVPPEIMEPLLWLVAAFAILTTEAIVYSRSRLIEIVPQAAKIIREAERNLAGKAD